MSIKCQVSRLKFGKLVTLYYEPVFALLSSRLHGCYSFSCGLNEQCYMVLFPTCHETVRKTVFIGGKTYSVIPHEWYCDYILCALY